MGKPTGFIEYSRLLPADREPAERLQDWNEFHQHFEMEKLKEQAARCMDCGIPFCHTGTHMEGGIVGCPINNLIPEWNDLVYRGKYEEAYRRLTKTNSFPEFTGRVCPAPCEGSCTAGLIKSAVTIKNIEAHIVDYMFEHHLIKPRIPEKRTGKKVAVVGSGPSGLACADSLNQMGHDVTVYERADRPGGLLMYGIPNMKLDKTVISRRLALMEKEGVQFITQKNIGVDYGVNLLLKEYDAVALCCGATKARKLNVPGSDLKGVYYAVDFLTKATQQFLNGETELLHEIKDKRVMIIGGGDTGTDCVATSLRLGCKNVVQIEIMPELPNVRQDHNPWPYWPRIRKTDYGQEEAIFRYNSDPREYNTTLVEIQGNKNAWVHQALTAQVIWEKDAVGRLTPVVKEHTKQSREVDIILLAMGFLGPEDGLADQLDLKRDSRSNILTNNLYQTNQSKIFAAGDMRRGQSLVVWAIREGRQAALACNKYLLAL